MEWCTHVGATRQGHEWDLALLPSFDFAGGLAVRILERTALLCYIYMKGTRRSRVCGSQDHKAVRNTDHHPVYQCCLCCMN